MDEYYESEFSDIEENPVYFSFEDEDSKKYPRQSLVLDLDETLVHSFTNNEKIKPHIRDSPEIKHNYYDFKLSDGSLIWGLKRPGLDRFMDYIDYRFANTAVWSAGVKDYVHKIVNVIKPEHNFITIYSREYCTNEAVYRKGDDGDNYATVELKKPLQILFSEQSDKFTRHNTLIIDDREEYCSPNTMNWIVIPEFSPTLENMLTYKDNYLYLLEKYLETLETKEVYNVMEILGKNDWFKNK